jgi:uncharacterized protein YidB (DUF937 family)
MGIFASIVDAVAHAETGNMPNAITTAVGNTSLGGLAGIVTQLQQAGLDKEVQSWLGSGRNLPVSVDQIRGALSDQHVQEIARELGLPVDSALQFLSQHLPAAVDQASPNGTIQPST